MIRKAKDSDIIKIAEIYEAIHDQEEMGQVTTGWKRAVYPTEQTARDALQRGDLYVYEQGGSILAAGIINQIQDDFYSKVDWEYKVPSDEVCVLHTLVVSPSHGGKGIGRKFVEFYEDYAYQNCWYELRMDTNERNLAARHLYKKLGYKEVGLVPTDFNGISDVNLVVFEKNLKA